MFNTYADEYKVYALYSLPTAPQSTLFCPP